MRSKRGKKAGGALPRLYLQNGYLDISGIASFARKSRCAFIFIIGARQVGKTYGVLQYILRQGAQFIYLRRTGTELDMLCDSVGSPFEKIPEGAGIEFKRVSDFVARMVREKEKEDDEIIGLSATLGGIGNIRGFGGDAYPYLVFDEFIPEKHMRRVKFAGDAFLNAYTTINGNREIEGREPLMSFLLANTNKLASDILDAFGLIDLCAEMDRKGEEIRAIENRGILMVRPHSEKIVSLRKQGALYRAVGGDSDFSKMAYGNEFSYDDRAGVGERPLAEFLPLAGIGGLSLWMHKSNKEIYIRTYTAEKVRYKFPDTAEGRKRFLRKFPNIRKQFWDGYLTFQNAAVKAKFLEAMEL